MLKLNKYYVMLYQMSRTKLFVIISIINHIMLIPKRTEIKNLLEIIQNY